MTTVNGDDKEIELISQKTSKIDIAADAKQQEDGGKPVKASQTLPTSSAAVDSVKSEAIDANTATCDTKSSVAAAENNNNNAGAATSTAKPIAAHLVGDNKSGSKASVEQQVSADTTAARPVSPKVNHLQPSSARNGVGVIPDVKIEVVADTPPPPPEKASAATPAATAITSSKDGGNTTDSNICTGGTVLSKGSYSHALIERMARAIIILTQHYMCTGLSLSPFLYLLSFSLSLTLSLAYLRRIDSAEGRHDGGGEYGERNSR